MKFLVCIIALAVAVSAQEITEEQKAKWKKWSDECKAETGVSQEAINNLRSNNFVTTDAKVLDHSLCFAKKSGLSDADGNINVEAIKERLGRVTTDQDEINRIITKCTVEKATKAQTAFDTFKCLRENTPKFSPV